MQVIKSTENNYCIIFAPTELKLFESQIPLYTEYMVKDVEDFIKFLLQEELRTIAMTDTRGDNRGH